VSARAHLRTATAEAHERVDQLFSRFDLSDPGRYGDFLVAQAAAFLPAEEAISGPRLENLLPDWTGRRRSALLLADLAELGRPVPPLLPTPALTGPAALLGAAYVLEGSRLGGTYLKRAVGAAMPVRFLAAPQARGAWRILLATLDRHLTEHDALDAATQGALRVFALFETAARSVQQRANAAPPDKATSPLILRSR
jgi:heme oxygenase